jgi:CO/xanthine dehydrogenase FAD-binding subunit
MKIKDFVFASKVSEACSYLKQFGDTAYLLAGGTSTFFISSKNAKVAIDINRIPIKGISKEKGLFRIGAGTTIDDILKYKEKGWVLDRVGLRFVNHQVRNISTIGGNISRIFNWSDFPVALRVLDGTIKVSGATSKRLKISEAFSDMTAHKSTLKNSLLEYIEIPVLSKGMGFGYSKETRTSSAFSSLTVAAFVKSEKGIISEARIAFGAVVPFPARLFELEEYLKGKKADLDIVKDIDFKVLKKYTLLPKEGMTLEYCVHLLKTRIKDVICEAINEAAGDSND